MNEVVLLQSAQADLLEIFGVYGEASYRRIDAALEAIRKMPELAPIYHDHFRRKLVEGTPYGSRRDSVLECGSKWNAD